VSDQSRGGVTKSRFVQQQMNIGSFNSTNWNQDTEAGEGVSGESSSRLRDGEPASAENSVGRKPQSAILKRSAVESPSKSPPDRASPRPDPLPLDELVAIKCIPKEKLGPISIALVSNERMLYRSKHLAHKHIVCAHEAFDSKDASFIVMEFLKGASLDKALRLHKDQLSPKRLASVFRQLLLAVCHLHQNNVAHRDIKPENLVFTDVDMKEIKLIDLGSAYLSTPLSPREGKIMVGTLPYSAPELVERRKYAPHMLDAWSVGATLVEIVTGSTPFPRGSPEEVRKAIVHDTLKFRSQDGWGRFPKPMVTVAEGLLEKDPDQRMCVEEALHIVTQMLLKASKKPTVGIQKGSEKEPGLDLMKRSKSTEAVRPNQMSMFQNFPKNLAEFSSSTGLSKAHAQATARGFDESAFSEWNSSQTILKKGPMWNSATVMKTDRGNSSFVAAATGAKAMKRNSSEARVMKRNSSVSGQSSGRRLPGGPKDLDAANGTTTIQRIATEMPGKSGRRRSSSAARRE